MADFHATLDEFGFNDPPPMPAGGGPVVTTADLAGYGSPARAMPDFG